MTIDRRVLRTRNALYDALVSLIRRRDYASISVDDILTEANVGRSTFYAHFKSKDDLLQRSLERLRSLLDTTAARADEACDTDPALALFQHIRDYADVQIALSGGPGGTIVREAINRVIAEHLHVQLRTSGADTVPRDLIILHIVGTFDTTLTWWFRHRREMDARTMYEVFRKLLLQGVTEEACGPFLAPARAPPAGEPQGCGNPPLPDLTPGG